MTDDRLLRLLSAANPMPPERLHALSSAGAVALLDGVLAEPRTVGRAPRRKVFTPRRALALGAVTAAVVAAVVVGITSTGGGTSTAWGAQQIRFAEASPLVLLEVPGWRVDYANEDSATDGELHFRIGPAPPPVDVTVSATSATPPIPPDTSAAELNWEGGSLAMWIEDRANDAAASTTAPVLGTTAHVYEYKGAVPGHRDITALFRYDGRVLEFRAGAADMDAFKKLLAQLTAVDAGTWLAAMPASVVKPLDRDGVVAGMLRGIPLPAGFKASDIPGSALTKDRYQLGAAVSGTIACEWFRQWGSARRTHDAAAEQAAVTAMATAKDWPVLKEMAAEGGYPDVLAGYAAAMPSGEWYGRPLLGDVNEGLGCSTYGVDLGG